MPIHPFLFYTQAYNIVFASCWCVYFGSMRKRERLVVGGSKERCKLHGISFSFNPLYLVLIPVVSGRRPETKETVCERQTDLGRWTPVERLWWFRWWGLVDSWMRPVFPPLQFPGTPRAGSCGNCWRWHHDTGAVLRGRKSFQLRWVILLLQTWRQQEPGGVEPVSTLWVQQLTDGHLDRSEALLSAPQKWLWRPIREANLHQSG